MHEPYYREAASAERPRFTAKIEGFEKRDGEVSVPSLSDRAAATPSRTATLTKPAKNVASPDSSGTSALRMMDAAFTLSIGTLHRPDSTAPVSGFAFLNETSRRRIPATQRSVFFGKSKICSAVTVSISQNVS